MKIVLAGVAILLVASVVGVGVEDRRRVEEATARIERFAVKLERTKSVAPETIAVVSDLIRRYNCEQLSCGAVLEKRNHAARIHLQRAVFLSAHIEGL
jgi:phytoene/squalene synthetase